MHIDGLCISNLKRLHDVDIRPEGRTVIMITGPNAAGKSSVFDAILMAATNAGLEDPIRHGADKATIKLSAGEYEVSRTITRRGTTTTVRKNGEKQGKAQATLNELFGSLAIDPMAIFSMKQDDLAEQMRLAAGLDFTDVDAAHGAAYQARTTANNEFKRAELRLDGMVAPPAGTPDEEQSAAELSDRLEGLREQWQANRDAESQRNQLFAAAAELAGQSVDAETEIERLEAAIAIQREIMKKRLQQSDAKHAEALAASVPPQPAQEEIDAVKAAIANVDNVNAAVRAKHAYADAQAEAARTKAEAERLDAEVKRFETQKRRMIDEAAYPVPGMTVDGKNVFVNSTPISGLCSQERLDFAVDVAMAQHPKIKVILARDAQMLDEAHRQRLIDRALAAGYQPWLEIVACAGSDGAIHIEEGRIASIDGKPVEAS